MCLDLRNGTLQEKTLSETEFQHSVLQCSYLMNKANAVQGTEVSKAPCE